MKPIQLRSTWRYVGPDGGHGMHHMVLFNDGREVITSNGTHSWLGAVSDFRKAFQWLCGPYDAE